MSGFRESAELSNSGCGEAAIAKGAYRCSNPRQRNQSERCHHDLSRNGNKLKRTWHGGSAATRTANRQEAQSCRAARCDPAADSLRGNGTEPQRRSVRYRILRSLQRGSRINLEVFPRISPTAVALSGFLIHKQIFNFLRSLALPIPIEVIERGQCARVHVVDINGAVQVVDLMLQNARVPSRGRDHLLLARLVETFNCDSVGTRN